MYSKVQSLKTAALESGSPLVAKEFWKYTVIFVCHIELFMWKKSLHSQQLSFLSLFFFNII